LGGKRLSTLYKELNVVDAESLKTVCEDGSIKNIRGFGAKTVQNILQGLKQLGTRPERLAISDMLPIANDIEAYLQSIEDISRYSLAGSLRRLEETVKDIDFIIVASNLEHVREKLVTIPHVKEVIANRNTKVSVTVTYDYDINVDLLIVSDKEFETTLHHYTGSKEHNVLMRQRAKKRGEKINEYGAVVEETNALIHSEPEQALCNHFNLQYIPPELRHGR